MKKVAVFSILGLLAILTSAPAQDQRAKASIPIIENPLLPKSVPGKPRSVRFELDRTYGTNGATDGSLFNSIQAATLVPDGSLYVLDAKEGSIIVLDAKGRRLRAFGRKGSGPGEFSRPQVLFHAGGNRLLVYDGGNRRATVFALDGKVIEALPWTERAPLYDLFPGPRQGYYGWVYRMEGEFGYADLDQLDAKLSPVKPMARFANPPAERPWETPPRIVGTALRNGGFVFGNTNGYALSILDETGALIREFRKAWTPVVITKEDILAKSRDRNGQFLPFTENILRHTVIREAFSRVLEDASGNLWIGTSEKAADDAPIYDIFSSQGVLFARVGVPGRPFAFEDGAVLVVGEDWEGFPIIKKMKLVWVD